MMLPYFIPELSGIGGVLKQRPEDFVVHELPRYEPCGEGEHVMAEIEKVGLSTIDAVDLLARRLGVPRRDIGYAGLKDTNAVTRQWVTVRGTTPGAVADVAGDKLKVLYADRHRNKLRLGHLAGNRFAVKIRDVDPMKVVTLTPALRTLARRGMPNYFGPQRFGRRDRNDTLGLALARQDAAELLAILLGGPDESDQDEERAARTAYDDGDLRTAVDHWPRRGKDERDALRRLLAGEEPARVVAAVDRRVGDLWLSALQSRLFNAVLTGRIDAIDGLLDGDLAYKHDGGAVFRVESAEIERPRVERFEISPTGPLLGPAVMTPTGPAAEAERRLLIGAGILSADVHTLYGDRESFDARHWITRLPPGTRRSLRVRPDELRAESGIDEHGPYIAVSFVLPAGAYATVLLRELMRNDPSTGGSNLFGADFVPS